MANIPLSTFAGGKPLQPVSITDFAGGKPLTPVNAAPPPVAPVVEPKKDLLQKAADIGNAIFPGTKIIGESLANAGAGIADLATGGIKKFNANAKDNATDIPKLAGAIAGNAGTIATAAIPGAGAGAKLAARTAVGVAQGYASDVSTNLASGKENPLVPGFGTAVGAATPFGGAGASAIKNATVKFADAQAPRIINSLIKPLAKDFSYGKNPGRTVAALGIKANNFDDLASGINRARQETGAQIGSLGQELSTKPVISVSASLDSLDDAMREAAKQNNSTLLTRLQAVKRSITHVLEPVVDENTGAITIAASGARKLDGLTFQESRDVLRNIGDMTQFTGNPSDDKLVNSALKRVYGSIKEASLNAADQINPERAKDFRKLTEQYADLTSAKVATEYRGKIAERQDMIKLKPLEAGIGAAVVTAIATGGASIPASLTVGLAAGTIDALAGSVAFKTRLAAMLSQKTPQEVKAIYGALPFLQKILPLGAARLNK